MYIDMLTHPWPDPIGSLHRVDFRCSNWTTSYLGLIGNVLVYCYASHVQGCHNRGISQVKFRMFFKCHTQGPDLLNNQVFTTHFTIFWNYLGPKFFTSHLCISNCVTNTLEICTYIWIRFPLHGLFKRDHNTITLQWVGVTSNLHQRIATIRRLVTYGLHALGR